MGLNTTKCPYCNSIDSQEWQMITIPKLGAVSGNSNVNVINAIEIYCRSCHSTLSITPVLTKN